MLRHLVTYSVDQVELHTRIFKYITLFTVFAEIENDMSQFGNTINVMNETNTHT